MFNWNAQIMYSPKSLYQTYMRVKRDFQKKSVKYKTFSKKDKGCEKLGETTTDILTFYTKHGMKTK